MCLNPPSSTRSVHRLSASRAHVPLEVLQVIFNLVYVSDPERHTTLDLGLVCRDWWEATLLSRQLWTRLAIGSFSTSQREYQNAERWFKRSGQLPRTLEYGLARPPEDGPSLQCSCQLDRWRPRLSEREANEEEEENDECYFRNPILVKLLAQGPPLERLVLHQATLRCVKSLAAAIKSSRKPRGRLRPWDLLKSFNLTFPNCRLEQRSQFLHLPPAITSLELILPNGVENRQCPGDAVLAPPTSLLQRLTTFTIQCDWEGSDVLSMIKHCTNVETLTIHYNEARPEFGWWPHGRVTLPKVRRLHLWYCATIQALDFLATPALSELDLKIAGNSRGANREEQNRFCHFLSRFLNTVTNSESGVPPELDLLTISDVLLSPDNVCSLLFSTIQVRRLVLDELYCDHGVLWEEAIPREARRTNGSKTARLFQHLELLELWNVGSDFPLESVLQCLEEIRDGGGLSLRVGFQEPRDLPADSNAEESADRFLDAGFQLSTSVILLGQKDDPYESEVWDDYGHGHCCC